MHDQLQAAIKAGDTSTSRLKKGKIKKGETAAVYSFWADARERHEASRLSHNRWLALWEELKARHTLLRAFYAPARKRAPPEEQQAQRHPRLIS